ncbi:MAG: hypothetical protein QOI06_2783 [Nocardioidaceae bacterium]|nr:hypothetical protein [Nocardioidaceae bacterium]
MRLLRWLSRYDRDLAALRRASRAAIVMPAMFALGDKIMGNPEVATFAAFGSFAMLLLVDFSGPMRDRLQAQVSLAIVGGVFVCVGTLASGTSWLAAGAMTAVAFAVLFAGVVSSVLATATPALLLSFVLPVSLSGPVSEIPDRLAGWGLASAASLFAIAVMWPAPNRDPLRGPATTACRALAVRLRSDVARVIGGQDAPSEAEHHRVGEEADRAVRLLRQAFLATPYRPTGLTTATRTVVRLVDELDWLGAVVRSGPRHPPSSVNRTACEVKVAAASVLERGADLLAVTGGPQHDLYESVVVLRDALSEMEKDPAGAASVNSRSDPPSLDPLVGEVVSALNPTFRAQELAYVVSQIANNIELAAAAERRSWRDRLLGRQPKGVASTLTAAQERASAHIQRSSVWLHNSVRGAIGLGLAVLVANLSGVQHSFWVVLGALSVLRSNALSTGQNVARGLIGTALGFVIGAALLVPLGTNTAVLWCLLPLAILLAGAIPASISFAAGQAGFTVTLVVLFNIIAPTGWSVGLLRVEDVALGCAVSLLVGLLFWPRGATAALGRSVADAYRDSARYLADAVAFGMLTCEGGQRGPAAGPPVEAAMRAAASSRRLDDAFRNYLAERGTKPASLADVTGLVNGVGRLRLAADAVLDLWQRDADHAGADRAAARDELLRSTTLVVRWYDALAASLVGAGARPEPLAPDDLLDERLVDALRPNLVGADGCFTDTAARMIWTGDYLDAVRRLQVAA